MPNLGDFLPAMFPKPPLPGIMFREEEEEEEKVDHNSLDEAFRSKMKSKGFDPELVEMGLKVADNLSRSREEALKVGENYIREMSK